MAYQKQTWTDELLDPKTLLNGKPAYRITDASGKVITDRANIDLATTVSMAGTKVDAAKLSHMENGIAEAATAIDIDALLSAVVDALHPVGSVIMTYGNVNPATTMPGTTWVSYATGRVLLGVGSNGTNSYAANTMGGSDSITLTESQMPKHTHDAGTHTHVQTAHNHTNTHTHSQEPHKHYQDSHTHTVGSHTHTQAAHTHTQDSHNHTQNAHMHDITYATGEVTGKKLSLNTGSNNYRATTWAEDGHTSNIFYAAKQTAVNQAATATNQSATPAINAASITLGSTTADINDQTPTINSTDITVSSTTATNKATAVTLSETGGDGSIDIRQAYRTVYCWRRTE